MNTALACLTVSLSRRLLNMVMLFLCLEEATALITNTTKVVVFIPPAVEPGLPPISIKTIVNIEVPCVILAQSTVLKPAVLGVTAWNSDANILYFIEE